MVRQSAGGKAWFLFHWHGIQAIRHLSLCFHPHISERFNPPKWGWLKTLPSFLSGAASLILYIVSTFFKSQYTCFLLKEASLFTCLKVISPLYSLMHPVLFLCYIYTNKHSSCAYLSNVSSCSARDRDCFAWHHVLHIQLSNWPIVVNIVLNKGTNE